MDDLPDFEFYPLVPERWQDFASLFGVRGACGGCWCMYWRQPHREYEQLKGDANRQIMHGLVHQGVMPGLLAYNGSQPAGWVALAPRSEYIRLKSSRILKPVDEQPVWSVVCFFIAKPYRRQGLTRRLLDAALDYAHQQGAEVVEAYPVEPSSENVPPVFAYTGFASTFTQAGFEEVARRSASRPIMRYRFPK